MLYIPYGSELRSCTYYKYDLRYDHFDNISINKWVSIIIIINYLKNISNYNIISR